MKTAVLQTMYQEQNEFFAQCREQKIRHSLLRNKKPNAGFWLGMLERALSAGLSSDDAEIFIAALTQDWGWPWKKRDEIQKGKDIKRWIAGLSKLNSIHPIICDIHTDLFDWLCDIFTYIPRDIWTAVTRLMAALTHHSRSFKAFSKSEWGLCDDIDAALEQLMPLNISKYKKPKGGKTTKIVFKKMGSTIEGNKSHSHRHGLYLLWWNILYQPQEHHRLFSDNTLLQPLLDIDDSSCQTVLYLSILDAIFYIHPRTATFSGVASSIRADLPTLCDWNTYIQDYTPISLSSKHASICINFIHKRLVQRSWIEAGLDAQCFVGICSLLARISIQESTKQLYTDLQLWLSMQQAVDFADISYDLLSEWCTRRIPLSASYYTKSPLEERYQKISGMEIDQKITHLDDVIHNLASITKAKRLSTIAIKRSLFDYWLLMEDGAIFTDSKFHILHHFDAVADRVLSDVDIQRVLEVQSVYSKKDFAQLLIVLVLLQSNDIANTEIAHFVRKDMLESLFFMSSTNHRLARVVTNLIAQSTNQGIFTPLGLRFYYNLIKIKDKKEAFRYFLELFTQNPSPKFYPALKKNFVSSYHLMGHSPAESIDWAFLCEKFEILDKKRDLLLKEWKVFQKGFDVAEVFREDIDLIGISERLLGGYSEYSDLLIHLNKNYHGIFFEDPYPIDIFTDIVQEIQKKSIASSLRDMEESFSWYRNILQNIHIIEEWMDKHGFYHSIDLHLPFERLENLKELIQEGDFPSVEKICQESIAFLTDKKHDDKMSWPERFLWISVVAKMLHETRAFMTLRRQCSELDRELIQADFGFQLVEEKFTKLNREEKSKGEGEHPSQKILTAKTYWEHLHDIYGEQTKEVQIITMWMKQRGGRENEVSFEKLMNIFAYDSLSEMQILNMVFTQIVQNPSELGIHTYATLQKIIQKREQKTEVNNSVVEEQEEYIVALRKEKMYDLIASFRRKSPTIRERCSSRGYFMPIVLAYTLSLTQLLDIGDGLVDISKSNYGNILSGGAIVMSVVLHFSLPYKRLRAYGYGFQQVLLNTLPTFVVSLLMAGVYTVVWLSSYEKPLSGLDQYFHFVWMYFFSEMVIAAGRGAFQTD